ncbi:helix-turn-helix domain-containing protein [Altererythrobacter sp. Z27]|uniref:helix-turn-helix domain-containing protein n=1 Tax=Altererythrobacter sp. Z27 TaxID=3461147 RepID=UPI004043BE79
MAADWEGEHWHHKYAPKSGTSRDGMPLSINRPPADDLQPWVARLVAAKIEAAPGSLIRCGMCTDLSFVRIVLRGDWTATSADGTQHYRDEALLFGPHSRYMPLSCSGPVMAIGVGLRPGALPLLTGRATDELVDRIEHGDPLGLIEHDLFAEYSPDDDPEQWLERIEGRLRRRIAELAPPHPDPISTAFELAGFADPNLSLSDFSELQGISLRKLERMVKRDFGLTPKQVLRRARALDIAAQLCGVADDAEAEELMLRYFDQSHLIREFAAFFGTTPSAFRSSPRPLMTLNVEIRQARRLEELDRLRPGQTRPWFSGK